MTQYRKKPVVVDAWQHWDDAGTRTMSWPRWLLTAISSGEIYSKGDETFVKSLEGDMRVTNGDWIIKGVKGELYPCNPDIFAATYDLVVPA